MDKRIRIIFELSSMGFVLNEDNLRRNFISSSDIVWLVNNNIIKKADCNKYVISDINMYLEYGIGLLKKGNYNEANFCLSQCYNLEPMNRDVNLRYMRLFLIKEQYYKVLDIYDNLVTIESDKYDKENNLYLYLFSRFMRLDDKYIKKVKLFSEEDIRISNMEDNKEDYYIVKSIYNSKYANALKLINDRRNSGGEYYMRDEVLHDLLNKAADSEKKFKREISLLVDREEYTKIKRILVDRQRNQKLSKFEMCIYLVVDALIDIKENGIYRVPVVSRADDIYMALIGNNFELASRINDKFHNANKVINKDDILSKLLKKINSLEKLRVDDSDIDCSFDKYSSVLTEANDLANYIRGLGIDLNKYIKKVGLLQKYALLVKLVYARDYYIDGDYVSGDKILLDVSLYNIKDEDVIRLLDEVKNIRDNNKDKKILKRVRNK